MGWSLTNPSGTTSGGTGAAGVDGSTIITFTDITDGDPFTNTAITNQEQFRQFAINVSTFRLWELPPNTSPTNPTNYIDHDVFKGTDGLAGAGFSSASYDATTGQVTFTGSGGNSNVVTADLRGADGTSSTFVTGGIAPTTEGTDGDIYIDTSTGDVYGPKTAGSWGSSSLNINGIDGKDVTGADTSSGDLVITLSDGSTINAGGVLGADGGTPNISIGTVTTGASGTSATVSLDASSTALNKILNFTIPRGADGLSGADGVDGVSFTETTTYTRDSGTVGQIHVDSEEGTLLQKREQEHMESITISFADYSQDDTTLDPNGLYTFTGFYETTDGAKKAQYALDRDDGSPKPDYIITFDETENEWELKSNTDPMPPPLARCPNDQYSCGTYPSLNLFQVEAQNYPNATLPSIVSEISEDGFIFWEEKAVTQIGSFVNEGTKTPLTIPQKKGFVRGIPYFGVTHTMTDGTLHTGTAHTDSSQVVESTTSLTTEWKLDKVRLSVTGACEVLVYVKTSDNIVVTDDDSVGIDASYLGTYTLQTTSVNGKNSYINGNNRAIQWTGTKWEFRDVNGGTNVRDISDQAVDDPSILTRSESNLLNIYPERKTLTVGAFTDNTGNTHTNTGTTDTIVFGSAFSGELFLEELSDEADYPEVYFQLLTKDEVNLSVSFLKYQYRETCWVKLVDVANAGGLTLGGLTNVNPTADVPSDGQIIRWSGSLNEWMLSAIDSSAWHGSYGTPATTLGSNGDYHFNFITKDISRKENGVWIVRVNTSDGADGVSISSIEENDGTEAGKPAFSLTITLDDGTEFTTSSLKGDTGANGSAGGLPAGGSGTTSGTGTGDVPFTPASVSSPFWLDSSKSATIVSNTNGILTWTDAYAQGINLSNTSANNAFPDKTSYTGVTTGFTPIDVVTINSVDDILTATDNIATSDGDFNLFGIFQIDNTGDGVILDLGNGANGSLKIYIDTDVKLDTIDGSGTTNTTVLATSPTANDVILFGIKSRALDYEVRINGALVGSAISANITSAINTKTFTIGDPAETASAQVKHCEWVLGLEHITDEQAQQKEGYLAHKWGMTDNLPSGHPHKTTRPIVSGGSSGQVLMKIGDGDYDVAWVDQIPYNKFNSTGVIAQYDVSPEQHGETILADGGSNAMDVCMPYDPADGWQVHVINRNSFPVRILAKDAGGANDNIIPDGGWAIQGDLGSASWLKNNGDSCTATWDAQRNQWLVIGNVRTYEDAFSVTSSI